MTAPKARYRSADRQAFALHDAQLVLARSYGFDSWPKLKAYVDGVTARRLVEAVRAGDFATVEAVILSSRTQSRGRHRARGRRSVATTTS